MFRLKIYLYFVLVVLGAGGNSLAKAQQAGTLANPNPNNFDTAKIMQAIRNPHSDLTTVAAHRGIHALAGTNQAPNVPENSLQAIGFAAQEGWESIEIDIKLTSDGTPILSHDKTWGREWCGLTSSPYRTAYYDPFTPPGDPANDSVNPAISATSLANTRSFFGQTWLRDSVNIVTNQGTGACGSVSKILFHEYPPTLQDVYNYINANHIQLVVTLDVQSLDIAKAAWTVVQANTDYLGRPFYQSTIFKIPAILFSTTNDYLNTFGANYTQVQFNPVFHTSGIAPAQPGAADVEEGGDILEPAAVTFGSEQAMIQWINTFEHYNQTGPIDFVAIEVSMKDYLGTPNGAILSSVLPVAATNQSTGKDMTISQFNPVGEYYPPDDSDPTETPQFFSSANGSCCQLLSQFLFNNANYQGPILYPNLPWDHDDNRTSLVFLVGMNAQMITTDRPDVLESYLKSDSKRNISYMQADGGASENANAVALSLNAQTVSAAAGSTIPLWAVLSHASASGTVTFFDGSSILGTVVVSDGMATFTINSITTGTHTYKATYSGDSTYLATASNTWTITVSTSNGTAITSSCDIYASGGTPCVAAHSTVRALYGSYNGKLYQVKRTSDGATADIQTMSAGGYANAAAQNSFCAGTSCTITMIYDQSPYNNSLSVEGPGGAVNTPDSGASANALPITVNGNAVYGVEVTSGVGYRNNATTAVAKNGAPEGMYMVTSGTNVNSGCCFDYGNAEVSTTDTGDGHMDALNFGTFCGFPPCSGDGPWVEADLENGQYMGNGSNTGNQSISTDFVTAMLKNNGQNTFALKAANSQGGGLITEYSGTLPTVRPNYIPMSQEGAIVLGTGGDNSDWGIGSFFEGAMTSGYPSDATENAVQANISAAGYNGNSGGSSSNGSGGTVYTGPNDPGGPGPQDGFISPAAEQPNVIMGSKPTLATFNGSLYLAFQGYNASNDLYVTSSASGYNFPSATRYTNLVSGGAPAMATFNNKLYLAFQGYNAGNALFVTSSATGSNFPTATGYGNILMGSAPALAVFNSQLYMAFQANDSGHTLHITASPDGASWPTAWQVANVAIGSAPAMAAFNGKLYVAFRANDSSNNVWIASSSDGVNFSSQLLTGQAMGGNSSPALVVSNGVLYYIYGANDSANELLVTATTDGSTWQGPAVYTGVQLGASGPGAAAFGSGVSVGFQSNDSRDVLFMTNKLTEAIAYTGPNDPGGPGPQDSFAAPASLQQNNSMGSKPALASFNGSLYLAFQANDSSHSLWITSSTSGASFPGAANYPNIKIGGAPGMAAFNNQLFLAFQANDASHELWVTSATAQAGFSTPTSYPSILMGGAPAMAVFNNKIYIAFQANDPGHTLHVTSSSDGGSWPAASQVANVAIGSDPAMAVFNGKLYIAFRANDPSNNVWIASSSDGVNFTSQLIAGQSMGGSSSPALAVSNCVLYYIYGANDVQNEMLVTASIDGSNWQGPAAYSEIQMGATGPGAAPFGNSVFVGFQSNDSRNVLFTTSGVGGYGGPYGSCIQ